MAYFHKDKNILHIGESENKYYTYDINTGKLIGLRGTEIGRIPPIFKTLCVYGETSPYYRAMILCIMNSTNFYKPNNLALFIDKYYAMPNHKSATYQALQYFHKNIDNNLFFKKDFTPFMNYCEEYQLTVSRQAYFDYQNDKALNKFKKYLIYNNNLTSWQKKLICGRLANVEERTPRIKKLIAKIMSHPNYWEYNLILYNRWTGKVELAKEQDEPYFASSLLDKIITIYQKIPALPLVKTNTINEAYLQVQRLASSYIAEQETRHKELYKSYLGKLKYEDENFTMIFPTTAEELQEEGVAQSNCVGGYYHYIADMEKFIVFIRDKKNIDKPLITCDVNIREDKTLHINQYLLSHNYTVTVDIPEQDTFNKDISKEVRKNLLIFKENFQKHLDKITIM